MVVDTKLYDILQVSKNATENELKKAYRDLIRRHHPDKGGDAEKFKEIDNAYKVLSNAELRRRYDSTGSIEEKVEPNFNSFDDLFTSMNFNMFNTNTVKKTPDVVHEMHIPLDAFYTGVTKKIAVSRQVVCKSCKGVGGKNPKPCPPCRGSGQKIFLQHMGPFMTQLQQPCDKCSATGKTFSVIDTCSDCKGQLYVQEKTLIEVLIPAGAPNGYQITKTKLADEKFGFETGSVHILIRELKHPVFTRQHKDLSTTVEIDLATALIGGKVTLEHLDGKERVINLPKRKVIRYGDTMTIKNDGMPDIHGGQSGNLNVTFHISLPSDGWSARVKESSIRKLLRDDEL